MGVDTRIVLPGNVRLDDVKDVLAILVGNKPVLQDLTRGGHYVDVSGVTVRQVDNMVEVVFLQYELRGEKREISFHFEYIGGQRLMMARSNAATIAIGKRLVDFFGGSVVFQDYNDKVNYMKPAKSDALNQPEAGEAWEAFQLRKFNVAPITDEELEHADKQAAYKRNEQ